VSFPARPCKQILGRAFPRGDDGGAGRQAARTLLPRVEFWDRTSVWEDVQPTRTVRWHPRLEPTVSHPGKRLSNGLLRLLCSLSLYAASRPRFGAVTQLSTGADSHYNGLQLTAERRMGRGLKGQLNYTLSRCRIKSPMVGSFSFPPGESFPRCRVSLPGTKALATTTSATTSRPSTFMNCHEGAKPSPRLRGERLADLGTAFWHSGVPFSVESTPYSDGGNGVVQGSGPQFASVVPGVPLYEKRFIAG